MSIPEAEERLSAEQRFLEAATIVRNPVAIALAESHINRYERELRELRLADEGGWKP